MCCSPHRFAVRAATHYHTRAWQTLIYGKECFILLLLLHKINNIFTSIYQRMALYFVAVSQSTDGWTFLLIFEFQCQTIYKNYKWINCCKILRHFIWVFTVSQSTCSGVTRVKLANEKNLTSQKNSFQKYFIKKKHPILKTRSGFYLIWNNEDRDSSESSLLLYVMSTKTL